MAISPTILRQSPQTLEFQNTFRESISFAYRSFLTQYPQYSGYFVLVLRHFIVEGNAFISRRYTMIPPNISLQLTQYFSQSLSKYSHSTFSHKKQEAMREFLNNTAFPTYKEVILQKKIYTGEVLDSLCTISQNAASFSPQNFLSVQTQNKEKMLPFPAKTNAQTNLDRPDVLEMMISTSEISTHEITKIECISNEERQTRNSIKAIQKGRRNGILNTIKMKLGFSESAEDTLIKTLSKIRAKSIASMVFKYSIPSETAEELFQEASFKACKAIHTFNNQSSLETWFYKIYINTINTYLSKNKMLHHTVLEGSFTSDNPLSLASCYETPYDEILGHARQNAIDTILQQIKNNSVLALYLQGYSEEEISTQCKITVNAVKNKKRAEITAIQNQLGKDWIKMMAELFKD